MPQDTRVLLPVRCIPNSKEALLRKIFFQQGNTPCYTEQNCPAMTLWTRQYTQLTAIDCRGTRFQSNWASAAWDWTFGVEIYFQSTWCYCGKRWSQHWLASLWNHSTRCGGYYLTSWHCEEGEQGCESKWISSSKCCGNISYIVQVVKWSRRKTYEHNMQYSLEREYLINSKATAQQFWEMLFAF